MALPFAAALLLALSPPQLPLRDSLPADTVEPPVTLAFLGDQGLGPLSESVIKLIKAEAADMVVHLGDFEYTNNPAAWEDQYDRILGPSFPLIAVAGNHDLYAWAGPSGYGERIRRRLQRLDVPIRGEEGVKFSFRYKGIFFVFTAPGLMGTGHPEFIRQELASDTSIWRISSWHMNQARMNAGSKPDEVGWGVYEESRKGGAIVATAHEHIYCRTHLLSDMTTPVVASRDSVLRLRKGRTFAFVSGLGGGDVRYQYRTGDWWAQIYSANQGAVPGALFATFRADGDPRKARFRFKAINGAVADSFTVVSEVDHSAPPDPRPPIVFPFPTRYPRTVEVDPAKLGIPAGGRLRLDDLNGRSAARADDLRGPVSLKVDRTGILFMRTGSKDLSRPRMLILLP